MNGMWSFRKLFAVIIIIVVVTASITVLVLLKLVSREPVPSLGPLARFQDSSATIAYGLGYLSGEVTINGSTITGGYYNSTECFNNTGTLIWNIITIFNDVDLTILALDRNLTIYALDSSSVSISAVEFSHVLEIYAYDSASVVINGCNTSGMGNLVVTFFETSTGVINETDLSGVLSSIMSLDISSVTLANTTSPFVYAKGKSHVVIDGCNINMLGAGIYALNGTLTFAGSSLPGGYVNSTTITNSIIANKDTQVVHVYGTTTVILQSYTDSLQFVLYENSTLSASDAAADQVSVIANDRSSFTLFNSTLWLVSTLGHAAGVINGTNLSGIYIREFSNVTLNASSVNMITHDIHYSAGTLAIASGSLPPGYHNGCTLIDATYIGIDLNAIYFCGATVATISGPTPAWDFWALGGTTLNVQSATGGNYYYYDGARGGIQDSTIDRIGVEALQANQPPVVMDHSTANRTSTVGLVLAMVIRNGSVVNQASVAYWSY